MLHPAKCAEFINAISRSFFFFFFFFVCFDLEIARESVIVEFYDIRAIDIREEPSNSSEYDRLWTIVSSKYIME